MVERVFREFEQAPNARPEAAELARGGERDDNSGLQP
jgi:hypothetical protein